MPRQVLMKNPEDVGQLTSQLSQPKYLEQLTCPAKQFQTGLSKKATNKETLDIMTS